MLLLLTLLIAVIVTVPSFAFFDITFKAAQLIRQSRRHALQQQQQQQQQQQLSVDASSGVSGSVLKRSRQVVKGKGGDRTSQDSPMHFDYKKSRVKVAGNRFVVPGDYVVHERYGIGQYVGVNDIHIKSDLSVVGVVVRYRDSEITWFQKFAEEELWVYRTAESGEQELDQVMDARKWMKRKANAESKSKSMAMDLVNMMAVRNSIQRMPCRPDDEEYRRFEESFLYQPTPDQRQCFDLVAADMINSSRPMDRLICGDVGFGKTEVAVRAIYRAVQSGKQVALLAPTRVLAKQHERTLLSRMPSVNVQLLRGGGKGGAMKVKEALRGGSCQVVVGTHALLQADVVFDNLGLLVVDEEQRFGVAHKERLKTFASGTDVLTLSATPIPRTLQLSLTGMKDFSAMQTPPVGRKEVIVYTGQDGVAVESSQEAVLAGDSGSSEDRRVLLGDVIERAIKHELSRGGQVFVVVPFVRDVPPTALRLRQLIPDLTILEAHGQHDDLEDRVDSFLKAEASVLVATTVIENGIDMPNVNTIIVLQADRFGISSLYQLKGRVGRSSRQAYAYFLTQNSSVTVEAEQRLNYIKTFTALGSGYDLSRRDMEMRGHGTIFGSEQSGAKDIGLDLQAKVLASALESIKEEVILSSPDARIEVGGRVEAMGIQRLQQSIPSAHDTNAIARWEAALVSLVLSDLACRSMNLSAKMMHQDSQSLVERYSRRLLSCTAADQVNAVLSDVGAAWGTGEQPGSAVSSFLTELGYRCRLRVSLRTLGAMEVRYLPGPGVAGYVVTARDLTEKKWRKLEAALSPELSRHVDYRSTTRGSECVGIVRIRLPLDSSTPDLSLEAGDPDTDPLKLLVRILEALSEQAANMLMQLVERGN